MEDQICFSVVENLLLKLGLETQALSQRKSELNKQIELLQAETSERQHFIDTKQSSIQKLDIEILARQDRVTHNRDTLKSLKETSKHLLHYEHTLKADLENTKANYNRDKALYEERIANYRETFHTQKQYFCQRPLAQKLIQLQGEIDDIESRIKSHDEKITMRQQELDRLTAVTSSSTEKPVDSDQQLTAEDEENLQPDAPTLEVSSLRLSQHRQMQQEDQRAEETNVDDVQEEKEVQENEEMSAPESSDEGFQCSQQSGDQAEPDEMQVEEQETFVQEELDVDAQVEEEAEKESGEEVSAEMDTTVSVGNTDEFTAFPQTPLQGKPFDSQSTSAPATPAFTLNFGPGSSPHADTSDMKTSFFSLHAESSGSGYSDFGFHVDSPPEGSSFPFFNEKKSSDSKSGGRDFLFNQAEQNEDFKFPFDAKSPDTGNEDSGKDEFPFNF